MFRSNINKKKRKSHIGLIIYNHIKNNKREYFTISILFFVGIFIGIIFINNIETRKIIEINNYLNDIVDNVKKYENIDFVYLLRESIYSSIIMILFLWLGASTIIGIPIVYGTILLKGFSIGFTISSIIMCFGVVKGVLISLSIMLLHNIVFIPSIFGASVSGIKLYQSIIKNKNRDNITMEILRHTVFCLLILAFLIISSVLEVYISTNIFIILLKLI